MSTTFSPQASSYTKSDIATLTSSRKRKLTSSENKNISSTIQDIEARSHTLASPLQLFANARTENSSFSKDNLKRCTDASFCFVRLWKTVAYKHCWLSILCLQSMIAVIVFVLCSSENPTFCKFMEKFQYPSALQSTHYHQWLLVSIFVAIPLAAELFLDIKKLIWGTSESRLQWMSFFGLNISFLLPSTVLYNLLHGDTHVSTNIATYHLNLLVVQQAFLLASLLGLLLGPKLYHGTSEMRFNFQKTIERASVHAIIFVFLSALTFALSFQFGFSSMTSWALTICSIVCLAFALILVCYISFRLCSVLGSIALQHRRIINHHQLFDLGVAILLIAFCVGDFVIVVWTTFGFSKKSDLSVEQVLVGYTAMQIILTGLIGLLNGQRSKKYASFKNEKLQGRLNLIRYVSHEMRTPLNTAFMGLNILSSDLDLLKTSCLADIAADSFSNRSSSASSSSASSICTSAPKTGAVSFRSDMVYVGKSHFPGANGTVNNLATDTNASSSTQLDAFNCNSVSFSHRVNTGEQHDSRSSGRSASSSDISIPLPHLNNASRSSLFHNANSNNNMTHCGSGVSCSMRSHQTNVSMETIDDLYATVMQVSESCKVALTTLDELLMFDKLDEKKLTIEKHEAHPWAFLSAAVQPFKINAREAQVKLDIGATQVDSQWFNAVAIDIDQFKLSQVIRNLLSNAIKFTPTDGKVTVLLEPLFDSYSLTNKNTDYSAKIPMNYNNNDMYVRISVTDSGAGISPENQKKLFGQYVQFNASKLQKGKGSGLGLWITKSIVDLHGGRIGCHSEGEGRGSTFYVDLPVRFATVSSSVPPPVLVSTPARSQKTMRRSHSEKRRSMLSQKQPWGNMRNRSSDDDEDDLGNFDSDSVHPDMLQSSTRHSSSIYLSFFGGNSGPSFHAANKDLSQMTSLGSKNSIDNSNNNAVGIINGNYDNKNLSRRSSSLLGDIATFLWGVTNNVTNSTSGVSNSVDSSNAPRDVYHNKPSSDPEFGQSSSATSTPKRPSSLSLSTAFFSSVASPSTPIGAIACILDGPAKTLDNDSDLLFSGSVEKPGNHFNNNLLLSIPSFESSLNSPVRTTSDVKMSSTSSSPTRYRANSDVTRPIPSTPPHPSRIPTFMLIRNSPSVSSPSSNKSTSPVSPSISVAGYVLPRNLPLSEKKLQMLMMNNSNPSVGMSVTPSSPSHVLLNVKSMLGFGSNLLSDKERIIEGADGEEDEPAVEDNHADAKENEINNEESECDGDSTCAVRPDLSDRRLSLTVQHEVQSKPHRPIIIQQQQQEKQPSQKFIFPSVSPEHMLQQPHLHDGPSSPALSLPSSVATTPQLTPQLTPQQHDTTPIQFPLSPSRSPLAGRTSLTPRRIALGLVPDAQLRQSSRQNSQKNSKTNSPNPTSGIIKTPPRAQLMTRILSTDDAIFDKADIALDSSSMHFQRGMMGVYDVGIDDDEMDGNAGDCTTTMQVTLGVQQGKENSPAPMRSQSEQSLQQDSVSSLDSQEMDSARIRYANLSSNNILNARPIRNTSGRNSLYRQQQYPSQQIVYGSQDGTINSYSTAGSRSLSASISRTNSRCLDLPSPRVNASNANTYAANTVMDYSVSRSISRNVSIDLDQPILTSTTVCTQLNQPLSSTVSIAISPHEVHALDNVMRSLFDSPEQPVSSTLPEENTQVGMTHNTFRCWEDGLNILVVDDSAPNRKICARLLSSKGHNVVEAVDGRHCLELFQRLVHVQQERVDLILLDDNMPNLCGSDTAKVLRSSYDNNNNMQGFGFQGAIFGVTGDVEATAVARFEAAGANTVIAKPLAIETLKACYERFCNEHSQ